MELHRLHDKSTVNKLTQLKIITQIENFKLNEGESKKKRVTNPLQSKRKTLSSMRKLPKTLLPSGRPYAWCACDGFVDSDSRGQYNSGHTFFQINVLTSDFSLLSVAQLAWFHNHCVHLVHFSDLPVWHLAPVQPRHKQWYPFLVNPDWQVPLFLHGELPQGFWGKDYGKEILLYASEPF